jgi:hypothetical protein
LPHRFLNRFLVRFEEKISHGILARRRELNALFPLKILDEELVWDRSHNSSAVTVSCI